VSRRPCAQPLRAQEDEDGSHAPKAASATPLAGNSTLRPGGRQVPRVGMEAGARSVANGLDGNGTPDEGPGYRWTEAPDSTSRRAWNPVRHDTRHPAVEWLGPPRATLHCFAEVQPPLGELQLLAMDAPAHDGNTDPTVQATRLAQLLLSTEPGHAAERLLQLVRPMCLIDKLCEDLIEPTARHLGDLWQDDACNEFDVALALGRLQVCWRGLQADLPRVINADSPPLLVVPCPGESHMLGAALHADVLWRAGWDAHIEFPADDNALDLLVAGNWFAALDLTLSAAFRREHRLPGLAATIARARAASRNPSLVVMVGGRVFDGRPEACAQVGADAVCDSASRIESTLTRELGELH
jgi:hypothetical protein